MSEDPVNHVLDEGIVVADEGEVAAREELLAAEGDVLPGLVPSEGQVLVRVPQKTGVPSIRSWTIERTIGDGMPEGTAVNRIWTFPPPGRVLQANPPTIGPGFVSE